jgi:hypothetical protein
MLRRVRGGAIATAGLGVLLWLAYGLGFVGYDGAYALLWGRDLAEARLPGYDVVGAPTPHPLAVILAALLAPLRDAALPAMAALWLAAFAAAGVAAWRLGRALFSAAVGGLFALLLLTRDFFVNGVHQALVEVPFIALVLWALALEATRPRSGTPVLVLLAASGLLRPEGWVLAGAYGLYLVPRQGGRERALTVALVAVAPLTWLATDLIVTGDALHSLHHTQSGAERLDRPRDLDVAFQAIPDYLGEVLHSPAIWGGLAGLVLGTWLLFERAALPAIVLAIGLASFLVLGVAQVPVLPRYFYVPAGMLALFCAVAVFGWVSLPGDSRARRPWMAAGLALAVALVASAPRERERLAGVRRASLERVALQGDLRDLLRRPSVRAWLRACPPLQVRDGRVVPLVALWTGRRAGQDTLVPRPPRAGLFLGPPPQDRRPYTLDPRVDSSRGVPAAYEPLETSRRWALYRGC